VLRADVAATASRLAGEPFADLEPVRGGGNNRLFRARGTHRSFAVKVYPDDPLDARERYTREFDSLTFLWRQGERRIPEPVGLDEATGIGLFAWVDGNALTERRLDDIDALTDFAARLREFCTADGAAHLAAAREAVFSEADLAAQIRTRLARLRSLADPATPALHRLLADIQKAADDRGEPDATPLDAAMRTLSPSDFGFHNALRTPAGLVFLDFEYFGWDDPVKLVADVLWHPGMALEAPERQRFLDRATDVYRVDRSFRERFERDAPVYGLRWALIILNEFIPAGWQRRIAAGETTERHIVLERQLAKAGAVLARVRGRGPR